MEIVKSTRELKKACAALAKSEFITIDTEFIRETTFWPELCLVQMASNDETVLVDPLENGIDLSPLWELMGDETTMKVFHAARQDIEIVYNMGGLIPHPVFDTQIAAMVCGFGDSIAYDQLVSRITGATIDKSSRFTNWRQRPLTDKQIRYALADVTHLIEVYRYLKDQLEKTNRLSWVNEEMDVLTSRETYDLHPEDAWKRLKMRIRKPIEFAIMQSVAAWRERQARERNVPRNRVLKDDAIFEIAQQAPKDREALFRLRSVPKSWRRANHIDSLLEAIDAAMQIPPDKLPRLPARRKSPDGCSAASELLKVLLKMVSEEYGVAPKILATSDDIDRIAAEGAKADVAAFHGWRKEIFGDSALRLLRGEMAMKLENRKVQPFLL